MTKDQILEAYTRLLPQLPHVLHSLETRLHELLNESGVALHSLEGRLKSPESLADKLARPDRDYRGIEQLTDLVAFRVIVLSEDLIEEVAKVIERSFDVDYSRSTNKLHRDDPSSFGYRSLHYVCTIPDQVLQFEIQIRTILQHTWAEIEHDIGYKAGEDLPPHFRRRFSQIASLLEVADREFVAIRSEIKSYEARLRERGPSAARSMDLDQVSLRSVVDDEEVRAIDTTVSNVLNVPLGDDLFYPDYLLRALRSAGLRNGHAIVDAWFEVRGALKPFVRSYFEFARRHWKFDLRSVSTVKKGYGLLFIAHLSVLRSQSLQIDQINRLTQFYRDLDYPDDIERARQAAHELVAELRSAQFLAE